MESENKVCYVFIAASCRCSVHTEYIRERERKKKEHAPRPDPPVESGAPASIATGYGAASTCSSEI